MTSFQVPRSWSQFRAVGIAIRALSSSSKADYDALLAPYLNSDDANIQKLTSAALAYVKPFFAPNDQTTFPKTKVNLDKLRRQLATAAKTLGPAADLALCRLSTLCENLTDPTAILAMFIHVLILSQPDESFSIKCVGASSGEDEADNDDQTENQTAGADFDSTSDAAFPDLFPPQMDIRSSDLSFTYKVIYVNDPTKEAVLTVNTTKMNKELMVVFVIDKPVVGRTERHKSDPLTFRLIPKDYISAIGNLNRVEFAEKFTASVESLDPRNGGLGDFVLRSSSSQLWTVLQANLITPVFEAVCPEALRNNQALEAQNPMTPLLRNSPRPMSPPPGMPTNPLFIPRNPLVGPGNYGDNDLFPNFAPAVPGGGIGGNLFLPGHPNFPQTRPPMPGRPDTLPPGGRFDPIHGGPGPAAPTRPRPGAGRGRGSRPGPFPGEPDNDELPPPGNFGFYG